MAQAPHLDNPVVVTWPTVEITSKLALVIDEYDVVLIDLAGRDDRAAASVLAIADIMISPTKPSWLDMSELGRFIRVAQAKGVPHVVVFNEATREASGELKRLVERFPQYGPYLGAAVQQLMSYRRAYALGRGVLEYKSKDDPAKINFARVFEKIDAAVTRARARTGEGVS